MKCRTPHVSTGSPSATEHTESTETSLVRPKSANFQLSIFNSQLPPKPYLGSTYLRVSAEEDLIRDYAAESQAADRAQEKAPKYLARRSSTAALVDGIFDGSYGRFLKGE